MTEAAELLKRYNDLRGEIGAANSKLCAQHSQIDKKVADLQHEIEFGEPDACTMVHIFQELQATLKERRTIKNEIHILGSLISMTSGKTAKLVKFADGDTVRRYTPRVLTALDFSSPKNLLKSRKRLVELKE